MKNALVRISGAMSTQQRTLVLNHIQDDTDLSWVENYSRLVFADAEQLIFASKIHVPFNNHR